MLVIIIDLTVLIIKRFSGLYNYKVLCRVVDCVHYFQSITIVSPYFEFEYYKKTLVGNILA